MDGSQTHKTDLAIAKQQQADQYNQYNNIKLCFCCLEYLYLLNDAMVP